jgi:hypothetical protein
MIRGRRSISTDPDNGGPGVFDRGSMTGSERPHAPQTQRLVLRGNPEIADANPSQRSRRADGLHSGQTLTDYDIRNLLLVSRDAHVIQHAGHTTHSSQQRRD